MDIVVLIGRVLFVVLFVSSAIGHFSQTEAMTGYARSQGVPAPRIGVLASGVLMGLGALSILLGVWADLGALLLFIMLLPTAFFMHRFWAADDPQTEQNEMIQFNKDLALAGASLMLFAFFAHTEELGLTLTGPLFHL
ncbi:DoxX family protein [Nocardia donostiensis]|uniref:DoxX family protein n=1 Tax=Nocardia donostiensis TaxID=1538463 RepID=A0A1W0B9U2_9NOCA|nr:DoxX family protein [Nocardia donostiensis]ONM46907.1 DoxX family protein [Nocardia donostiensis]OQS13256.1 DoxX family protein [Nocardia donostiensis]OQS19166.1 DoxX family protein [Nocardia donostiensis]